MQSIVFTYRIAFKPGAGAFFSICFFSAVGLLIIQLDIHEANDVSARYPDKTKELAKLLTQQLKQKGGQLPRYKATGKAVVYPEQLLSLTGLN